MIAPEREAEILRLYYAEKWKVGTIAAQLGMHHSTVRRVLAQAGVGEGFKSTRPSIAEPYIPLIVETLEKYPKLPATRVWQMAKERGYPGACDYFRTIVARYRPRPKAEAYLRLRTLPGEQAQVDWGHFGTLRIGRAERKLMAFVMVLSWSRQVFLRFFLNAAMPSFLRGHVAAFEFFSGVPRVLLYDNLKSAVLERRGEAIRFHPTLLELSSHYRFEPRPVAVARGNEKGRVERAIRYIRGSFFMAGDFADIDDLNVQAEEWYRNASAQRKCPEDETLSVGQAFEQERAKLLQLPGNPFPTDERVEVKCRKTPYIRFDLNDYSIPHDRIRRELTVVASVESVRIFDGTEQIAQHTRSWDRKQTIEEPDHVQALVDSKREAREHRGIELLHHAAPSTKPLLIALAERGVNLGGATTALLRLLKQVGAQNLEDAVAEAVDKGSFHVAAVHHILERRRYQRGLPPPVGQHLPDKADGPAVRPHRLSDYDAIGKEDNDDSEKH